MINQIRVRKYGAYWRQDIQRARIVRKVDNFGRVPTKPGPPIWTPNMDPQYGPQYGPHYGPHYGPPSNGVNSFESSMEHFDNMWFHALLCPTLPAWLFQSQKTRHVR